MEILDRRLVRHDPRGERLRLAVARIGLVGELTHPREIVIASQDDRLIAGVTCEPGEDRRAGSARPVDVGPEVVVIAHRDEPLVGPESSVVSESVGLFEHAEEGRWIGLGSPIASQRDRLTPDRVPIASAWVEAWARPVAASIRRKEVM